MIYHTCWKNLRASWWPFISREATTSSKPRHIIYILSCTLNYNLREMPVGDFIICTWYRRSVVRDVYLHSELAESLIPTNTKLYKEEICLYAAIVNHFLVHKYLRAYYTLVQKYSYSWLFEREDGSYFYARSPVILTYRSVHRSANLDRKSHCQILISSQLLNEIYWFLFNL